MASTDFGPIRFRTDMAVEAQEALRGDSHREIPGVRVESETPHGLTVTRVEIFRDDGARLMGKPKGHYITIDVPLFKERDPDMREHLIAVVTDALKSLIPDLVDKSVLVVGLGNWNATPDALGPRTIDAVMVTRHLKSVIPEDVRGRVRSVSAIAPGVLGTTGIETFDVIKGIVRAIKPDLVIAIDALAARNMQRLVGSVQVADTGIHPGSGVGNHRHSLTKEGLGVPVIAVGVPTVVQVESIVLEAIHMLAEELRDEAQFFEILHQMKEVERQGLVDEVIRDRMGGLMVTPKEIDVLIQDMAGVLAESLNRSLQPQLDRSEWA